MNFAFKLLLTVNATSWMLIIYAIKESWTIANIPSQLFAFILLFIPVILSGVTIWLSKFLGKESSVECVEFSLADGEFLPIYLGYFFISVGVPENFTMFIVYAIVFVFTYISKSQYFNPIFLLFGYHYYHILTANGTRIFVIRRGKIFRNKTDLSFSNLRRINDTSFIEKG